MPAQVVIVHDDLAFATSAALAFEAQGLSVIRYEDALAATDALAQASKIELLITCLDFGQGRSNGIALASMVRLRKRGVRFMFIGPSDPLNYVEGLGVLLIPSVTVADLLAAAQAHNWSPDGTASFGVRAIIRKNPAYPLANLTDCEISRSSFSNIVCRETEADLREKRRTCPTDGDYRKR
jgi:hypothetical protein